MCLPVSSAIYLANQPLNRAFLLNANTPTTNLQSMGPTSGEARVERVAATVCECDIARGGCDKRLTTPVEGVSHRKSSAAAKKDLEKYTRLFDDCTDFGSLELLRVSIATHFIFLSTRIGRLYCQQPEGKAYYSFQVSRETL